MRGLDRYLFSFTLLLAFTSASNAQTVVISPTMPSVAIGQTIQFSAQATTAVTWSAGGSVGGNATAGTISPAGLYQAPAALPGQNPVLIVANTPDKAKASTYVYLLALGPVITSVSPNPLPPGTYTVTIQGSGFQAGATVNNGGIQLTTTSVTSTTVKATGWQGPAASATFTVKNPGSIPSNSLTVPVGGSGPATYSLSVVNGSGSGTYAAGAVVNIKAGTPPAGQAFVNWSGATVAAANASSTTLAMPAANTTVTANYAVVPTYNLTVTNGSGSGSYAVGAIVSIAANAPPSGQTFQNWTGAAVANPTAPSTTLSMPAASVNVTATYYTPTYTLTVNGGSGSGSYAAGTVVNIAANAPQAGQAFQGWSGAMVANANSAATTVTMPASAATVTATYSAPVTVPYPVSSHPRLWITVNDLPRLQSWATSSNPVYQKGMLPLVNTGGQHL